MSYWVLQCKRCGTEVTQEWGCPLIPGWVMHNQEHAWKHACPHCIHEENKLEESFEEMRKEFWEGK